MIPPFCSPFSLLYFKAHLQYVIFIIIVQYMILNIYIYISKQSPQPTLITMSFCLMPSEIHSSVLVYKMSSDREMPLLVYFLCLAFWETASVIT